MSKTETAQGLEGLSREEKWRLVLGRHAGEALSTLDGLDGEVRKMDQALEALYGEEEEGNRRGGLGASRPGLQRWLGDVRRCFPEELVILIQQDAIEKKGLKQLLFEPEMLEGLTPSVDLAATLLSFKDAIPDQTKETARVVVRRLANQIAERLRSRFESSVRGALDRQRHGPLRHAANLDVRRTIRVNLRTWDPETRRIVAERTFFHARRKRAIEWEIIVALDQSGSMAASLIYGAIAASVMASLPAVRTHLVLFDTEVADLSEICSDPVEVLFGAQLGGGTDINRAVEYCQQKIHRPDRTILLLITDLEEGGNQQHLLARLDDLVQSGVKTLCLLALSDGGAPAFDHGLARQVRNLGIPAFACTPEKLPELIEECIQG